MLSWLNYLDRQTILPMVLLACFIHELGHYCTIRLVHGSIRCIRLTAVGAEMILERPLNYWQEGIAALAGPGVNLLTALLCSHLRAASVFVGINLALGCFNLIPIGQLDGGRALHCMMALLFGADQAQRLSQTLGWLLTTVFLVGGVLAIRMWGNVTLFWVAGWLGTSLVLRKRGEIGLVRVQGKRYNN